MIHYDSHMTTDRHKTPSFPLRINQELRAQLQASAKKNERSLNAEISVRLASTYKTSEKKELADLIRSIIKEELAKNK